MIPTPVYWKLDRIVLAATTEDGNVYEPALVFPHVQELTQALYELTEILPPDDTLRRTASPASPEEVLRAQMEVVELVAIHPQSECLLWLDPAKNPRIELAGDRPRRTLLDGFISWISTKAGMQPVPDYLQALMVMFRHSVQQRKLSEDSSQPANTTEPAATEPTATPMDTTEPVAAAPVTEPPTAPSPTQADSLLPVVSTTTVDTPMVVAAPSPEENHDTNAQVGKKRAQRTSPRKTSQASPRKVAPDVKPLVRIPLKSRKQGPFDKDYVSTQTAKTILEKAGFVFSLSGVSLPDKSQTFADEDELRHFLRQHGAPEFADCDPEDKKAIEGWIRQSLMRSGEFNGGFPKYYLEFSNYRDMQNVAGFQWQSCSLGNVYMYPHVDAKQTLHPFMDFVFASEPELILSLAKNGFPDYLYEKLSKEEMLGLEVFVDSWAYEKLKRNLFEQRQQETVHDASPGKRKTRSALHQDTKEASVASPPKKLRNGKSISPSKGTKAKASAGYHTPTKPTARGKTEFSTPTTAVTTMSTMTTEASVDALPWPPVMDAAASIGGATNRERLSNVISSLRESTQAPVFAENSCLAKNIKKIRDMIHTVIRSTGRHGGTVPRGRPECKALYVCGVPGTGKTMSISWLCQYLLQLHKDGSIGVERDDDDEEVDWKFLMLNNNSNVNSIAINGKIKDALKLKRGEKIEYKLKSTGLILVLDEMDSMLDLKDKRELLKKLTGYASDPENRFILIGISNSLMNDKFARIQAIGQFRHPVTFSAYTEDDLLEILRHRVGSDIFDDRALVMIARKTMCEKGDARAALGMAAAAAQTCLDKIDEDDDNLSSDVLVKLKDVAAMNRAESKNLVAIIEGLPQTCKFCLVALNALGQLQVSRASVKGLRRFVIQCTQNEDDILSVEDFQDCLESLRDAGVLRMETTKQSANASRTLMDTTVELGYQLEDVGAALGKVCIGPVYEKVAALARTNRVDLSA